MKYDYTAKAEPGARGCAVPDCDRRHYGRGWCQKHYSRWASTGSALPPTREELFWMKVDPSGVCWEWTAALNLAGYGRYSDNTRPAGFVMAHRFAYESLVGPIPDGLQLDHLCRNKCCVNPDHLEPVTHRVNTLRGNTAPGRNARKTHCDYGHEFTEANTYIGPNRTSRLCRQCARRRDHELRARRRLALVA